MDYRLTPPAPARYGRSVAELPESWGLTTQQRSDGKLDIIGKDDAGNDYRVRTTDGPEVTSNDLAELHDADRESYPDRATGARMFVDKLTRHGRSREQARQNSFLSDLTGASEEVVRLATTNGRATRPGMIEMPSTYGSTRKLRANWPKDWN